MDSGGNVEHVCAGDRAQRRRRADGRESNRAPEVRHLHLEGVGGVRRRAVSPHLIDQHVGRHGAPDAQ